VLNSFDGTRGSKVAEKIRCGGMNCPENGQGGAEFHSHCVASMYRAGEPGNSMDARHYPANRVERSGSRAGLLPDRFYYPNGGIPN
jgi:hypothetical protein